MSAGKIKMEDIATASITRGAGVTGGLQVHGHAKFVCYGPDGEIKWEDENHNLVVNEGLDHALDSTIAGGTQITSWFVGLTDDTPSPAAGDTLASHGGWTEFDEYTGNRQAFTAGAVSGQSVDNSASVASFPINNDTNGGLGGAFLASVSTGTAGTLYSVVALSGGNRVVNNGDTVEITYTFTSADDGA